MLHMIPSPPSSRGKQRYLRSQTVVVKVEYSVRPGTFRRQLGSHIALMPTSFNIWSIFPVQRFDEISHKGCLNVAFKNMEMSIILLRKDETLPDGQTKSTGSIAPGNQRLLYQNGYGLTINRMLDFTRNFQRLPTPIYNTSSRWWSCVLHCVGAFFTADCIWYFIMQISLFRSTGWLSHSPSTPDSTGKVYQRSHPIISERLTCT